MTKLSSQNIFSAWWLRIILFAAVSILLSTAFVGLDLMLPEPAFFLALLISSILVEKSRFRGRWYTFGIMFSRWTIREILQGIAIVIISFIIILIPAFISRTKISIPPNPGSYYLFFVSLIIFLNAASEELVFRGVAFQALLDGFGSIFTTIAVSLLFALAHIFNQNVTILSLINIFLAGILLSLMYIRTRSLWLPISFHFFWNWAQAVIIGSPVSGYNFDIALVKIDTMSLPVILFGGAFGIEGGLMATLALIISILLTLRYSTVSPYLASKIFEINYERFSLYKK